MPPAAKMRSKLYASNATQCRKTILYAKSSPIHAVVITISYNIQALSLSP